MTTTTSTASAKTFSWWRVIKALGRIVLGVLALGWFLSDYLIFVSPPCSYHEGGVYSRVAVNAHERIGLLALTNDAPYVILDGVMAACLGDEDLVWRLEAFDDRGSPRRFVQIAFKTREEDGKSGALDRGRGIRDHLQHYL